VIYLSTSKDLEGLNKEAVEQGKLLDKLISKIRKANGENSEKRKEKKDVKEQ